MKKKSRQTILEETDGGLHLFLLLVPALEISDMKSVKNVDSPISKGKTCFSLFRSNGKYLFKDHYTKHYGDIFEFIAKLNNLDAKTEFPKVLEIADSLLATSFANISEINKVYYHNTENGDRMCLLDNATSKPFIDSHFLLALPYLEKRPMYNIQLALDFDIVVDKNPVSRKFNYAKPKEAFYAIEIQKDQYYLLYNPATRMFYEFGQDVEFHMIGMERLLTTAYVGNIYLRETIVVTNRVEGLFWCHEMNIPVVLLLPGQTTLPDYFVDVILEKFPQRFVLLELLRDGDKQRIAMCENYGFEFIMTKESYLESFLIQGDKAIDMVFSHFDYIEDYEFDGLRNSVEKIPYTED